jgi:hypothetical protein
MSHTVMATPVAERQIRGLRGQRRRAYEQFEQTLAATGCAALGYRLTGEDPLPQLCVKHLRGADRVVVAFVTRTAWVLLVGPHAGGDQAADVYTTLYEMAGIARPEQPRTKPPCCSPADASAPQLDEAVIDEFVQRARALRR